MSIKELTKPEVTLLPTGQKASDLGIENGEVLEVCWKNGFQLKADPVEAAKECIAIYTKKNQCDAADILEAAKDKNSVMHELFDWNDKVAAMKQRLDRARYIAQAFGFRKIEIRNSVSQEPTPPVRLFVHTVSEEQPPEPDATTKRTYMMTTRALSMPIQRKDVLARARREMLSWQNRYRHLQELDKVNDAIDALLSEVFEDVLSN